MKKLINKENSNVNVQLTTERIDMGAKLMQLSPSSKEFSISGIKEWQN